MNEINKLMDEIKEQCGDCEAWSGTDCTRNPYTQGCLKDEKKLTDESTIDSLKEMAIKFSKDTYVNRFLVNAINLIHSLQENNGNQVRMRCDMQRKFDDLQTLCTEQKAEIERLTEENEFAKKVLSCSKRKTRIGDLLKQNAELQQQVNELKSENTELYKEHTALIAGSILAKQNIAKDTAKEILQAVDEESNGQTLSVTNVLRKRYGVEVE